MKGKVSVTGAQGKPVEVPGFGFFAAGEEFELPAGLAQNLIAAGAVELAPVKKPEKKVEVKDDGM